MITEDQLEDLEVKTVLMVDDLEKNIRDLNSIKTDVEILLTNIRELKEQQQKGDT